jgi:hypothetical protein
VLSLVLFIACHDTLAPSQPDSSDRDGTDTGPDSADTGADDTEGSDTAPDDTGPACAETIWETGPHAIDHGGVERRFRVYLPSTYDPTVPAPLLLAFHGWGGDGLPPVLDRRASTGNTCDFSWSWPLVLEFFDHAV